MFVRGHGHFQLGERRRAHRGWSEGDWGCTGCMCACGCVHCTWRSVHKRVCTRGCAAGMWECVCTAAHTQDGAGTGHARTEGTRSTQLPSERAARAAQAEKSKYLMKAPHSHETPGGCFLAGTACSRWSSQEASLNLAARDTRLRRGIPLSTTRVSAGFQCHLHREMVADGQSLSAGGKQRAGFASPHLVLSSWPAGAQTFCSNPPAAPAPHSHPCSGCGKSPGSC